MSNDEVLSADWLQDPLAKIKQRSYKPRKLKSQNNERNKRWQSFHFATRLKLEGADYFCRKLLGTASIPDDFGLPLLAHRELHWYLDAFFFELRSAYDILLQELNIIYAYDLALKPKQVKWDNSETGKKFKSKLPYDLVKYIEEEQNKSWFKEIREYRNIATHHYTVPVGTGRGGYIENLPLDIGDYKVSMYCLFGNNIITKDVRDCIIYLQDMARYIISIWHKVAQEFD